jgi:superfamily II DNA or RNA helicase
MVGGALAPLRMIRHEVALADDEADAYARLIAPYRELEIALLRVKPGTDWLTARREIARSPDGRRALSLFDQGVELCGLPRAKVELVGDLLDRHDRDRVLVFVATAAQAYRIAERFLVPVITAQTQRAEREQILERFRAGVFRRIVSARVLNEGVDVPDAGVAIVASGMQGARELIQRVGRVLRPAPGKEAIVHELVTKRTLDEKRARGKERRLAAQGVSVVRAGGRARPA